jgi:membrane protease YdiL (CAAX protease family)
MIRYSVVFYLLIIWVFLIVKNAKERKSFPFLFLIGIIALLFHSENIDITLVNIRIKFEFDFLLAMGLFAKVSKDRFSIFPFSKETFLKSLLYGFVGWIVVFLTYLLLNKIGVSPGFKSDDQRVFLLTIVSLWVAIGEELFFRGYLMSHLGLLINRTSTVVIIQAVIFMVLHLVRYKVNFSAMFIVLFIGIITGFLTRKTQNLAGGILLHFLINITTYLL